jgi:uncharacterized damage-inducible protein DinB
VTLRQFYLQRQGAEFPVFMRVLQALPEDQLDYRPHERSPSARQLVWTLTSELKACVKAVKGPKVEWEKQPPPPFAEMLALFDRWSKELADGVSKLDDADWDRTTQFYVGDKRVSEQPLGAFLWFILFDAIHHRGQLSSYLRPMGGRVPAIYGPSADDSGRAT